MKKILLLTILITSLAFTDCKKTKHEARTAKGAKVVSVQKIDPALLPLIDAGLDHVFSIAEKDPYNYHLAYNMLTNQIGFSRHGGYTVRLEPRSNRCETPGFLQEFTAPVGQNYDGSEWDKDPRPGHVALCAAGAMQVTSEHNRPGDVPLKPYIIVVADRSIIQNAARFEGEHAVYLETDRPKFTATMNHQNGGHPIMPAPNEDSEGLNAIHFKEFCVIPVK